MAHSLNLIFPLSVLDTSTWTWLIAFLGTLVIVSCVVKLVQGIRAVESFPGFYYIPFGPCNVPGSILPLTWWNPNFRFVWQWRKNRNLYDRFGRDTVSFVPFVHGAPTLFTRSLEVGKQILMGGLDVFDKSPTLKSPLTFWGPNVTNAHGDQWRKYRKISSPAFNDDTHVAVWDVSRRLFAEMMTTQGWISKDVIDVPSINSITLKFSLTVFTSVGFGLPLIWSNPSSRDHKFSVQDNLEVITETLMLPVLIPSWAWKLPFERIQRMRQAHNSMRAFMKSQIGTIREKVRSEAAGGNKKANRDLFSLLIRASEDEGDKNGLNDKELIGNMFSFLFAGHDTTSHALAATLALLSLDIGVQDEIASQVRGVTEGREDDTLLFKDYGKLDKVLAAFYETIRMFPPGYIILREVKRDTVLNISDNDEPNMLAVKKGTLVIVDLVGVHYHPKYYSDPEVYRPSRWYAQEQDQNPNVKEGAKEFVGFSLGPHACIGRKYSLTEAVCFLAHLVRNWRVEPVFARHPNGKVETVDEWRERVFQVDMLLTLGIKDHGVRFVRRK